MTSWLLLPLQLALALPAASHHVPATQEATAQDEAIPVGVPRWSREVVLKGTALKVRPADIETPLIVRIDSDSPHGTDRRYDFEYYGLEPGTYNLLDFLQRADGSEMGALPPLQIRIESHLPSGQVKPNPVTQGATPDLGGYGRTLWILGIGWVLGTLAWWLSRRRTVQAARALEDTPPPTLAERLAPLVERGARGELPLEEQARLELILIAIWRKRLGIQDLPAAEVLTRLKQHEEAGILLGELERWLHSPGSADGRGAVDPAQLLAPYRNLTSEDWDREWEATAPGPATLGQDG
ncbi:MAG TPA: hypothetical protein EYQ74_13905 [Planctomycetes bacterium]|nr:hypothetical protein [Planctomycetota bacterium]HIK61407.1 hypothetical protein [Planctomycetota bacterium]